MESVSCSIAPAVFLSRPDSAIFVVQIQVNKGTKFAFLRKQVLAQVGMGRRQAVQSLVNRWPHQLPPRPARPHRRATVWE